MSLLSRLAISAARAYGILSSNPNNVSADYLVVAGGGSGGALGGGGAGGYQTSTATLSTLNTYSITVGAGGAPFTSQKGNNGSNSAISGTGLSTVTSTGGGGGAGFDSPNQNGNSGGSGGGGGCGASGPLGTGGAGTSGQGFAGGNPVSASSTTGNGAGGGGASAVGSNSSGSTTGGNGGAGSSSSISGSSVTYAGGGGGGSYILSGTGTAGTGGSGGGGNGGRNGLNPTAGTANTGGGGGASGINSAGATNTSVAGGSGIVIISYTSATPKFVGGTITTSGGKQIHTFTSSGTLSPITPITASYLVVAGGGSGGSGAGTVANASGGGGAGGLLTGSTTIYSGATYVVTVGAGGAAPTTNSNGANGSNSVLSGTGLTTITSTGGGGGGGASTGNGANGGSGGGGGGVGGVAGTGGTGTSGQGNNGGTGVGSSGTPNYPGGGGGGATSAGGNATGSAAGAGGNGTASSITGSSVTYAGGGGGGAYLAGAASGGSGGGGAGGNTANGISGTANLGGGGGGSGIGASATVYSGGNGGSGIVIISYAGSQVFNGGLVTTSGGNTIHTFTSTGALTPLTNNLNNSLRFRSSASAYLNRTPSVAGNSKTWTWSGWVKRGTLNSSGSLGLFEAFTSPYNSSFRFASDTLNFQQNDVSGRNITWGTSAVFRDPSAWYHIVLVCDTTQAAVGNAIKMYVNGNQQTVTATINSGSYAQNLDTYVNAVSISQRLGTYYNGNYFDGYLTDVYLIDGQALEPYYFGNNDANGVWKPIQYKGTYGTNGFYLNFSNTTSTTTLGFDSSPNGNNWTCNNISLTAGTTYDAMLDVPTNTSATVANYAVWNPLSPTGATCADGNLQATLSTSGKWAVGTFAVSSGKYYFECVLGGGTPELAIGIAPNSATTANSNALHYYSLDGKVYSSNSVVATGATFTSGDIIGVAFEPGGNAYFYKNNTLQATVSMPAGSDWCAETYQTAIKTNTATINFGQRPFTYTPPTGYVALNTYNLLTPTILQGNKYMDATLYTQNGAASNVVVNAGQFKPDLVWLKCRSNAGTWNNLVDSVRGGSKTVFSNSTSAELTDNFINTFNSNGFTLNIGDSGTNNTAGRTQVAWQWQAGQGSTSSGTGTGGITSVVQSVNTTAGFSIVTYTGSGANGTVTHGLGVAPAMVIVKRRNSTGNWNVRHVSITAANSLYLNLTNASQSDPTVWNSTVPTSTVFSIGTDTGVNASGGTYVGYCWAAIAGYSSFGSYTGNGSADGPFVFTNFRPEFIMIKNSGGGATSSLQGWIMLDTSRSPFNQTADALFANNANASTSNSIYAIDILSNGFKTRGTDGAINESSATYIYMAFAENPFKVSNAR